MRRSDPSEPAELEMLDRAPRRAMRFRKIVGELERRAERIRKTLCVMTPDRQAAAFLRTIQCECADDDLAVRGERRSQAIDIGILISRIGQEMKCRAIVPDVVRPFRRPFGDVGDDPSLARGHRPAPRCRS